jgi:hypothetical protein
MVYTTLALLYLVQLIYVGGRWTAVTAEMVENARMERLRKAIDWTVKPDQRRLRR